MPSRHSGSKYSKSFNEDLIIRTIDVLHNNPQPMTINESCNRDFVLNGVTSQKMARVLTDLCNMGIAAKAKSKRLNRMVYVSTEALEEQGYDTSQLVVD